MPTQGRGGEGKNAPGCKVPIFSACCGKEKGVLENTNTVYKSEGGKGVRYKRKKTPRRGGGDLSFIEIRDASRLKKKGKGVDDDKS